MRSVQEELGKIKEVDGRMSLYDVNTVTRWNAIRNLLHMLARGENIVPAGALSKTELNGQVSLTAGTAGRTQASGAAERPLQVMTDQSGLDPSRRLRVKYGEIGRRPADDRMDPAENGTAAHPYFYVSIAEDGDLILVRHIMSYDGNTWNVDTSDIIVASVRPADTKTTKYYDIATGTIADNRASPGNRIRIGNYELYVEGNEAYSRTFLEGE